MPRAKGLWIGCFAMVLAVACGNYPEYSQVNRSADKRSSVSKGGSATMLVGTGSGGSAAPAIASAAVELATGGVAAALGDGGTISGIDDDGSVTASTLSPSGGGAGSMDPSNPKLEGITGGRLALDGAAGTTERPYLAVLAGASLPVGGTSNVGMSGSVAGSTSAIGTAGTAGAAGASGGAAGGAAFAGAAGAMQLPMVSAVPVGCEGSIPYEAPVAAALRKILDVEATAPITWDRIRNIGELTIFSQKLASLDKLDCLTGLVKLKLVGCQISNITRLGRLTSLTELDLSENLIDDLGPLRTLVNLESFTFGHNVTSGNKISLAVLGGLPKLRVLQASTSNIWSIEGLENHPSLQSIELTNNQLTSVSGMGNAPMLNVLSLYGNNLTSADGLQALHALETLNLSNQKMGASLVNVDGIAELNALRNLNVSVNRNLKKIEAVRGLTHLQDLNASGCGLTNVAPVAALVGLNKLNLASNQLSDISAIAALRSLESLDLSRNSTLVDISPLVANPGLTGSAAQVNLTTTGIAGTTCASPSVVSAMGALRDRGVKVVTDCR